MRHHDATAASGKTQCIEHNRYRGCRADMRDRRARLQQSGKPSKPPPIDRSARPRGDKAPTPTAILEPASAPARFEAECITARASALDRDAAWTTVNTAGPPDIGPVAITFRRRLGILRLARSRDRITIILRPVEDWRFGRPTPCPSRPSLECHHQQHRPNHHQEIEYRAETMQSHASPKRSVLALHGPANTTSKSAT